MQTKKIIATMPMGAEITDAPSTELKPQAWAVCQNAIPHKMQLRQRDGYGSAGQWSVTKDDRVCPFDRSDGTRDVVVFGGSATHGYRWTGSNFVRWGSGDHPVASAPYVPNYAVYADRFYMAGAYPGQISQSKVYYIDANASASVVLPGATDYQTQAYHVAAAIAYYGNHLLLGNTWEDGTHYPYRIRWSATGDDSNWASATDPSSGYADIVESPGQIMTMLPLGTDLVIYRQKSIGVCRYLGDLPPFSFHNAVTDLGIWGPKTLVDTGDSHIFLTRRGVMRYRGGNRAEPIDEAINQALLAEMSTDADDTSYSVQRLAWAMWDRSRRLYWLFYPTTSGGECDSGWVCHLALDGTPTWFKQKYDYATPQNGINGGQFIDTYVTADTASGPRAFFNGAISGPDYTSDGYTSPGQPIDFDLQTPDFVGDAEHLNRWKRWIGLELEARGASATDTLTVQYSFDRGVTWNDIEASPLTLDTAIGLFELWFDGSGKTCRLRFRNNAAGEQPTFRSYQLKYTVRAEY